MRVTICDNCRHKTKTNEGARCAANGAGAALLEQSRPVTICPSFVRISDGKQMLVDAGGAVGRRGR